MSDRRVKRLPERALSRGFSLTELMVVVAIIGVLAALGIAGIRTNIRESNTATAVVVVKSIAAAQEQYRALNQVYLDVSPRDKWFPADSIPANTKIPFWPNVEAGVDDDIDNELARWRQLNPDIRQPVDFVFMANAGLPSDELPKLHTSAASLGMPENRTEPWYVIQAKADADGDGTPCLVVAASWTSKVATANEGE